jgi:V8-like Glu-specific endopeptidase
MSALPQTPALPAEPATPSLEDAEQAALQRDIDRLLPSLYKADSTRELSGLLKIVARARAMGADGHEHLVKLAERLRKMRAFDDLYLLTSEMNANGIGDKKMRLFEVQALIELKVFERALDRVRPLLAGGIEDPAALEAYGLLGRTYKQMYLDSVSGQDEDGEPDQRATLQHYLERSFAAYMHVWHNLKNPDTAWHGINAASVAHIAERDGFTDKDPKTEQLTREVLAVVGAPGVNNPWALATMGEAYIALGDFVKATDAYNAYAGQPQIDAFSLASSLRQLKEVWGIDGDDNVRGQPVRLMKAALIAKLSERAKEAKESGNPTAPGNLLAIDVKMTTREARLIRNEVIGQETPGVTGAEKKALQKLFSDNFPFGVKQLRKGMERADGVCRIQGMRGGVMEAFATGFAIRGNRLKESWGNKPVIVTNNHVISSTGSGGSRRYEQCEAVFVSPEDDSELTVKFDRILWESEVDAHDITILRTQGELPASVTPLTDLLPNGLGPRAVDDNGIGRCYVIGFPGAKELSFSFADNVLLDHDCPDGCEVHDHEGKRECKGVPAAPVRIHYRTPTVGGSSGSPVFDGDYFTLLAVHHSGATNLARLNNRGGTYAANEGIWIDSIRQAIVETPADASAEAWDGKPVRWRSFADDDAPRADFIAVAPVPAGITELSGSAGERMPGVSPVARQVLYRPGKAEGDDIRAARLESLIGHDNRTRLFDTNMAPWRMICAIRARWGSRMMVGTGCFIGPNTVLTAGHVVFPREIGAAPDQIEIIPGLNADERPYESYFTTRISVHDGWKGPFQTHTDVAAIHLAEPVGHKVGWFSVAARTPEQLTGQWAHVTGYPGEKKEERDPKAVSDKPPPQASQLWHHAAPIVKVEANRIFYKADTTQGQSGAPIYVLREAGNYATPVVVGVHAYGTRSSPGAIGPANSGAWIDAAMLKVIAGWRTV